MNAHLKAQRLASEREQKTAEERLFTQVSVAPGYACGTHISKSIKCWGFRKQNIADKIDSDSPNQVRCFFISSVLPCSYLPLVRSTIRLHAASISASTICRARSRSPLGMATRIILSSQKKWMTFVSETTHRTNFPNSSHSQAQTYSVVSLLVLITVAASPQAVAAGDTANLTFQISS